MGAKYVLTSKYGEHGDGKDILTKIKEQCMIKLTICPDLLFAGISVAAAVAFLVLYIAITMAMMRRRRRRRDDHHQPGLADLTLWADDDGTSLIPHLIFWQGSSRAGILVVANTALTSPPPSSPKMIMTNQSRNYSSFRVKTALHKTKQWLSKVNNKVNQ